MPEFVLNTEIDADIAAMDENNGHKDLNAFAQGYIEAMFFTNSDTDSDDDLGGLSVYQLSHDAIKSIADKCATFWKENRRDLESAMRLVPGSKAFRYAKEELDETRLGHFFWYASQGHGVGFDDDGDSVCLKRLQEAGRNTREAYVTVCGNKIEHD